MHTNKKERLRKLGLCLLYNLNQNTVFGLPNEALHKNSQGACFTTNIPSMGLVQSPVIEYNAFKNPYAL